MNRKDFLAKAAQLGAGCCGVSLFGTGVLAARQAPPAAPSLAPPSSAAPPTPDGKRVEWARVWARRFFDVLDQELDEPTRRRILQRNGEVCHQGARRGSKPRVVTIEEMVAAIAGEDGPESIRREGDVIFFTYMKRLGGVPVAGHCLCPLVEDSPPGLSGTFCECSVGYVRDMFRTSLGRKVKVDLLESLKRGGKACRFRIEVLEA